MRTQRIKHLPSNAGKRISSQLYPRSSHLLTVTATAIALALVTACGANTHTSDSTTARRFAAGSAGFRVIQIAPFTLPCLKNALTTVEIEGCLGTGIARTDRVIKRKVKTVLRELPRNGRASFVSSEKSWLDYRRSLCESVASVYTEGHSQPALYEECVISVNRVHVGELSLAIDVARNP